MDFCHPKADVSDYTGQWGELEFSYIFIHFVKQLDKNRYEILLLLLLLLLLLCAPVRRLPDEPINTQRRTHNTTINHHQIHKHAYPLRDPWCSRARRHWWHIIVCAPIRTGVPNIFPQETINHSEATEAKRESKQPSLHNRERPQEKAHMAKEVHMSVCLFLLDDLWLMSAWGLHHETPTGFWFSCENMLCFFCLLLLGTTQQCGGKSKINDTLTATWHSLSHQGINTCLGWATPQTASPTFTLLWLTLNLIKIWGELFVAIPNRVIKWNWCRHGKFPLIFHTNCITPKTVSNSCPIGQSFRPEVLSWEIKTA